MVMGTSQYDLFTVHIVYKGIEHGLDLVIGTFFSVAYIHNVEELLVLRETSHELADCVNIRHSAHL